MLYHMADLSLINSFILRKTATSNSKLPLYEFKLAVATALMYAENLPEPLAPAAAVLREVENTVDAVRLDRVNHWPEVNSKIPKCCRLKGCKLRSQIRCTKCKVYLCLKANVNCFVEYHTA